MSEETLRDEIHKRHTLNWLIPGRSPKARRDDFPSLRLRDELNALNPKLVRLYDQYALINLLQYWQPDVVALFGSPSHFWKRASKNPKHPFYGHLLLEICLECSPHLAGNALERCGEKGVTRIPFAFIRSLLLSVTCASVERYRVSACETAKRTALTVWGIPYDRLDGELFLQQVVLLAA